MILCYGLKERNADAVEGKLIIYNY